MTGVHASPLLYKNSNTSMLDPPSLPKTLRDTTQSDSSRQDCLMFGPIEPIFKCYFSIEDSNLINNKHSLFTLSKATILRLEQ